MPKTTDFWGNEYWWDADYDPKTGVYSYREWHDHSELIEENRKMQQDGGNGFTQDREFRLIGRVPSSLLYDEDYRNLSSAEKQLFLRWLLDKHPEWRTVDKILHVDPSPGHIIVK